VGQTVGTKKKPTWQKTLRFSITSAYFLTGLPAQGRVTLHLVIRLGARYFGASLHMSNYTVELRECQGHL